MFLVVHGFVCAMSRGDDLQLNLAGGDGGVNLVSFIQLWLWPVGSFILYLYQFELNLWYWRETINLHWREPGNFIKRKLKFGKVVQIFSPLFTPTISSFDKSFSLNI